jgi:Glycosyl transferase family 2
MANPPAADRYEDESPATQPANRTVQGEEPAPPVAISRRRRSRVGSIKSATVGLVIPVGNEAPNIRRVLELIADDVCAILVDGSVTDAALINPDSCRTDVKVVPQERHGKVSALRTGFLAATGDITVTMA